MSEHRGHTADDEPSKDGLAAIAIVLLAAVLIAFLISQIV